MKQNTDVAKAVEQRLTHGSTRYKKNNTERLYTVVREHTREKAKGALRSVQDERRRPNPLYTGARTQERLATLTLPPWSGAAANAPGVGWRQSRRRDSTIISCALIFCRVRKG